MISSTLVGVDLNCQWPGFASTRTSADKWSTRLPVLVDAVKAQHPVVVIAQELGEVEAYQFFARMGEVWSYQRLGLNCVAWRTDTFDFQSTRELKLDSYGQMQRTALAVKIKTSKGGNRLRLASTHLAAKASDLNAARAIIARGTQIKQFCSWINDDADDWPTVVGMDANSRTSDLSPTSPRRVMRKYGWKIDSDQVKINSLAADAKRGIDILAGNYGLALASVSIMGLRNGSDHDGRTFTFRTTKA